MAEREGFEPSIRDKPYTPLAGERLQPLGHLSFILDLVNDRYEISDDTDSSGFSFWIRS